MQKSPSHGILCLLSRNGNFDGFLERSPGKDENSGEGKRKIKKPKQKNAEGPDEPVPGLSSKTSNGNGTI
jgi:hypothetical protein